jgi:hypothetical protein
MVVAPIEAGRESELQGLLTSMNVGTGRVDASNELVPFARFDRLHFARLAILDDASSADLAVYGQTPVTYPPALAFLGDCDGDAVSLLRELADRAGPGLRRLFACCGLGSSDDLFAWMRERNHVAGALYVNQRGRSLRQIREDAALSRAVEQLVDRDRASLVEKDPREIHALVRRFVQDEVRAGRLTLTTDGPPPLGWRIRETLDRIGTPIVALALTPLALPLLPILAWQLRSRERSDPEVVPPVDPDHAGRLAEIEGHDVTNQFSALGSLKPGRFRLWLSLGILRIADYATRHVFVSGRLARVVSIHTAQWVILDDRRRVFFGSNYDGSLESYMGDFINKVAWGLNGLFSNGVGYPTTSWLMFGGARDEQKFKDYIRRHQVPSQVWYSAHAGMTAYEIERHHRVRKGVEAESLAYADARAWCRLL